MDNRCSNCRYCTHDTQQGYCEKDYDKQVVPMYELKATWCTIWEKENK